MHGDVCGNIPWGLEVQHKNNIRSMLDMSISSSSFFVTPLSALRMLEDCNITSMHEACVMPGSHPNLNLIITKN